jgi:hypothetical protein
MVAAGSAAGVVDDAGREAQQLVTQSGGVRAAVFIDAGEGLE